MEKESAQRKKRKISIGQILLILAIVLISVPCVSFIAISKYEISKMHPSETQRLFDNIYIVRNEHVNFYLVKNDDGYIAIDAGISKEKAGEELYKLDIRPEEVHTVFLTHTDSDHVGALELFDKAKVYIYSEEEQMINGQKRRNLVMRNKISAPYQTVKDLEIVECSNVEVQVIATPGHTPGSMSLLVDGKYLFVGDTLGLKDNKAALLSEIFSMDTKTQEESIRKLAALLSDKIEYIFTAHYGYSDDLETVFKTWRSSEITTDSPLYMQKYNTYVNIDNHISTWLAPRIQSYIEAYESSKDLNAANLSIMPIYYNMANEALTYSKMQPQFNRADQQMEQLASELKKTYDMMNQIADYYKVKTSDTGDDKEIKKLHEQFMEQIDILQDSYDGFHTAFQSITNKIMENNLDKYKNEGHLSNYYAMKCIMSAQAIEQYLFREGITDDTISKIRLAEYQNLYSSFKEDYNTYNSYINSRKINRERHKHKVIASKTLSVELEELASAVNDITAKKLGQRNIQTMPVTLFNQHLSSVIAEYNNLVGMQ